MLEGIDGASYQRIMDMAAVKASGRSFVWLKATEGTSYVNTYFYPNWVAARALGLVRGAYCFLDDSDPISQAEFFLANVGQLSRYDMLAVDVEVPQPYEWQHVAAWLGWVTYRVGFRPVVYTGQWVANADPGIEKIPTIADFGLWVASPEMEPIKPWTLAAFQQYGTGKCPGVVGPVDLDRFNGSIEQLKKYGKQ